MKVCLCMMVKNEGHCIADALNSVKHLIDYWVISDTGSTDNTKDVIRETLAGIPGDLVVENRFFHAFGVLVDDIAAAYPFGTLVPVVEERALVGIPEATGILTRSIA